MKSGGDETVRPSGTGCVRQTRLLVVLFSDLVASTRAQAEHGTLRAAELVQEHRRIFRDLLSGSGGLEVETAGDSFLAVFDAPSQAVLFALRLQGAMNRAHRQDPEFPRVRVGIHAGEVLVESHEDGAKPLDLFGLQVSTAGRIMSLAEGGQTLCSRAVFDDARTILRETDFAGMNAVHWLNHGVYAFKGVPNAHEVCEVGEEGIAPLCRPPRTEKSWPADQQAEQRGWRPAAGKVVPGTNWVLEERLGAVAAEAAGGAKFEGCFSEVWKVWSPSLKSHRAFKFCFGLAAARALKREARLFERLRETPHPNLTIVYDAKDVTVPDETGGTAALRYLEMEYVEGPTFAAWLASNPPLDERLEVMAQVADALDRVHAAGIYHRDIKPSNILTARRDDGTVQAKLTDFGLGVTEDPAVLESLYASRVDGIAGTWDYVAPEVRAGGRADARSDQYSWGVTLYQVVVGNVKALPVGDWEQRIESEVLREDIRRSLAEAPQERWERTRAMACALRAHGQRLKERRLQTERDARRHRMRRMRNAAAVSLIFALLAFGSGALTLRQSNLAEMRRQEAEQLRQRAELAEEHGLALMRGEVPVVTGIKRFTESERKAREYFTAIEETRSRTEGDANRPELRDEASGNADKGPGLSAD